MVCWRSFTRHARSWRPCGRSQADTRPGVDVRLSAPKVVWRQQATVAGDRRQTDDGRNEGEVREVQEQVGARTGDHCGVLEPANPQADQLDAVKARRRSRPQFAAVPLLGWGELLPKHQEGSDRKLTFCHDVLADARHRWQRQRGQLIFVDRRRLVIGVHRRLVVVVGPEGIATEPLPDGHGLPWNVDDVDAIRASQQHHRSWICLHPIVVVIVGVRHDNVPVFMDECRYPQSADESSAGGGCPWTRRRQQHGVGHLGAWGGARGLGRGDRWWWCRSDAP